MSRKTIYLLAAILGTLLPWLFFANFFQQHGANLLLFARSLFVNGAAGGFSLDVLLSIAIFLFCLGTMPSRKRYNHGGCSCLLLVWSACRYHCPCTYICVKIRLNPEGKLHEKSS